MRDQNRGSGLKRVLSIAVIAFFVTLAIIIGKRMSSDAIAMVIGVACGVVASIPASLLILMVTSRRDRRVGDYKPPQPQVPPVVVVQGGQARQPGMSLLQGGGRDLSRESRQFELVGQPEGEVWS